MEATLPILILAIPLFMFLFLGLFGKYMSHRLAGILGTAGMGVTLVLAYTVAFTYFFSGSSEFITAAGERLQSIIFNWDWLNFYDKLVIRLGFILDPISAMMLVVITTISFMVHLYSNGYMRDHHGVWEKGFQRFYAFLSLFSFSMLGLVVATNIFQMYIFWELVGASSYLLIGFYYTKPSAVSASKKAFIVTRFADLGFLIGILVLSFYTGTFNFTELTSAPVAGMEGVYHVSADTAAGIKGIFEVKKHEDFFVFGEAEGCVELFGVETVDPAGIDTEVGGGEHQVGGHYGGVLYSGIALSARISVDVSLVKGHDEHHRSIVAAAGRAVDY